MVNYIKPRMAGDALNAHLKSIKESAIYSKDPVNLFTNGSDKLQHQPGMLTHGFAEQRLI